MKLALTLMVRDEADIIASMLEHHIRQGVDTLIVTDNGSVDGTLEILQSFADRNLIDLRTDPVQQKQQSKTVTRMARDAFTMYDADWVINTDADEFWLAVDRNLTLKEAFANIPKRIQSFVVPVVDMTGSPAYKGAGLGRLTYRDNRSNAQLRELGLLAHSTHDSAHIGTPDVVVSQGNHYVSLESHGSPDPAFALEVLHLPWRSWEQYRRKVENAGRAYEASDVQPSPNHHGMRDYQRLKSGTLLAYYVARHPDAGEIGLAAETGEFSEDKVLAELNSADHDVPFESLFEENARADGRRLTALENALEHAQDSAREERAFYESQMQRLAEERDVLAVSLHATNLHVQELRNRLAVRLVDGVATTARRLITRHR